MFRHSFAISVNVSEGTFATVVTVPLLTVRRILARFFFFCLFYVEIFFLKTIHKSWSWA